MTKGKKILLVGCGQIGSRHLQAIAAVPGIAQVHVVDGNAESLALGKARLAEVKPAEAGTKFVWHERLNADVAAGDLCILATPATGRHALVDTIAQEFGYRQFLTEKLVAQSLAEYDRLLELEEKMGLKIWVHFQTRLYPIFQYLKSQISLGEPIFFSEAGGNWGLACNGIHYVDLFVFLDGAEALLPVGLRVDPTLHPSKRGKDMCDLSGVMAAATRKGSHFTISYAAGHQQNDVVTIITPRMRWMVDMSRPAAFESKEQGPWQPLEVKGSIFVSQTSQAIIEKILNKGSCGLPDLTQARVSHEFVLGQLQPEFNRLLKKNLDHCPAT